MKTSHISIIIGIMIASCFILPDATAQVCFGGQACGEKPSSSFMDGKNVAVSLKFYSNSTVSNNIHYLWLRFFDKNTNQTIPHVSFFINATKDDKVMMHELFYTNTGSMTLQFSSGSDIEKWIVNGNAEPVLGGMMSDNDVLPIETSAFTSGTYHIHLVVLALVFANGLVDQNNPPTFDSWWSVDGKGNISQYDNSANSYVNPGPPPDPIFLVDNRHQIDNFLTNHEILIHYNANPIVSGSSPLDLEIKLANNGNLILDDKKYLILNDTHQAVVFWRFIPTLPGNYTLEKYNNGIHTSTTYFTVSDSKETLASPILVSPFKQMQAQIPISDIECENPYKLVIKSEDNSPACVKLDAAYTLIKRGWAVSESAYPGGNAQFALDTNSTIIPAHLPRSSGVRIPYYESSRVINYSGFGGIYNETFPYRGTQNDYVLKPGSTGVITYKIDAMASEQKDQDYPISLPKSLNLTNYAVFYHEITNLKDLSKYPGVTFDDGNYGYFSACSTGPAGSGTCIGGQFGGTNPIEAFVTDHPGVDVLFEPPLEMVPLSMNTTSQVVTMMITVDSNAQRGTYLVELPSIGADSFLLTVGDQPYHE